jgi:Domain of unknown function (DUF4893)
MSRIAFLFLLSASLVASGCARQKTGSAAKVEIAVLPEEGVPTDWRRVAHADDQAQLDTIAGIWASALTEGMKADAKAIALEGDLLRPDAALPRATPTPGLYRCRTLRIGLPAGASTNGATRAPRVRAFERFKPFDCVVTDEKTFLGFTKVTGTHRPGGYLWPDGDTRMVFLGGTAERLGEGASAYGADPLRNRFGVLERIGEFRWRMTLIGQRTAARLEVMELVPAVAVPVQVPR